MTPGAQWGCTTHPAAHTASAEPHRGPTIALHSQLEAIPHALSPTTYSFDIPSLSGRAGQAEAYHVHKQARDAQQVHGIPDEGRGDDIVDKEGPVVWQEHTPGEAQREQAARGAPPGRAAAGSPQYLWTPTRTSLPVAKKGLLSNSTYSNRTAASARNFLSNNQRKNTSKLWRRGTRRKGQQSEAPIDRHAHANTWKLH